MQPEPTEVVDARDRPKEAASGPAVRQPPAASLRRTMLAYAAAAVASAIAAIIALQLWGADLRVPFNYGGDAFFFGMLVKSVVDGGWWLTNPQLGAPGVLEMHDFPMADNLHLVAIKAMSWLSSDWALLFNLYFLLGFPLITLSALAVFRHFRIAYAPALAGSLLYAFAPSRLLKGEVHFFLDVFFQVPLALLVALWLCSEAPPLLRDRGARRWPGLDLRRGRSLAAVAICLLTAGTGIYYAFFTGVLMLLGGAWASIGRRTLRNVLAAAMLVAIVVGGLAVQAVPTALYHRRHGPNPQVAARHPREAEVFGMKMAQLLLPVSQHRIPALRRLKERYDAASVPRIEESAWTSLGTIGSLGFLSLLGGLLWRPRRDRPGDDDLMRPLAVLNLLALLLATVGGFGAIFALVVTPMIRGYARMNVIIQFLALFAVVLWLDRLSGRHRRLAPALAALVVVIGLFDQVTPPAVRSYAGTKASYQRDADFVGRIEAALPPAAMIFELPYQRFPEAGQLSQQRIAAYDPLRPYFHSRSLRWSYAAMSGRPPDPWIGNVSLQPPRDLVRMLSDAGFEGILIDRYGYAPDEVASLEATLERLLGGEPAIGSSDRWAFFNLGAYNRAAFAGMAAVERERRRFGSLNAVFPRWMEGFYLPEQGPLGTFRWSSGFGAVEIQNGSGLPRPTTISMTFSAGKPPATLYIGGDLITETIALSTPTVPFRRTLTIPPGYHVMSFVCDSAPADAPNDPRTLVWRVDGALFEDATAEPRPLPRTQPQP